MRYRKNAQLLASDAAELLREQGIPVIPQALDIGDIDAEAIRLGDSVEIAELPEGTFMVSVYCQGEWKLESVEDDLGAAVTVASVCYTEAYAPNGRLRLGEGAIAEQNTRVLRSTRKLPARNRGDLESAVYSAAYYAKKIGQTMYVYLGNSFGHAMWRVSYKPGEYLSPINNTGDTVISVDPELTVRQHAVLRDMQTNGGGQRRLLVRNSRAASKRCWGDLQRGVYVTPRGKRIIVAQKANKFRFYYEDTDMQVGPEVSYLRGVIEYAAEKGWLPEEDKRARDYNAARYREREEGPAPARIGYTVADVRRAAARIPVEERYLRGDKVWITDLETMLPGLTRQQLVQMHRRGEIELNRADMVQAVPDYQQHKIEESELDDGYGATYHVVRL